MKGLKDGTREKHSVFCVIPEGLYYISGKYCRLIHIYCHTNLPKDVSPENYFLHF